MAGTLFRSLFNATLTLQHSITSFKSIHTGPVYYAARKGTRAKARAKKVKVEITKVGFIPHNQRGRKKVEAKVNKHLDDSFKRVSSDDVYPVRYYRWIVYTAEEAIKAHQETHHPTMYNAMNSYVYAQVEMNMEGAKKNRYIDSFTRLALLPHYFSREEERTILAFCKGPELIKQVAEAGATKVGSTELIKKIQEGEIKVVEYDYVIAHPNILTELVPIRGLMKRRFPNIRAGTLDSNICELVKKFAAGIQYRVTRDENQQNFGSVEVPVGRLNMETKQIVDNVDALLKDIQAARPKRDGPFVTRCFLVSPPSSEKLKIDPFVHIDRTLSKEVQEESDDEDEVAVKA